MGFMCKEYQQVLKEYFDIGDNKTRKILLSIDEADQNNVLNQLTTKLYQAIMDKVDDIDFGLIPNSKGDITQIPNYASLMECLNTIENLLVQYKQETSSVDVIKTSVNNLLQRKEVFERGFKLNLEFPMLTYNTLAMAVVSSTSLLISTCIEFIKDLEQDNFNITLDKVGVSKSKSNLLFRNLENFNNSCSKGEFDKVFDYVMKAGTNSLIGIDIVSVSGIVVLSALALTIIPLLRELIYFFYYSRVKVSDYFEIQSDLLQMNMYNLQNSSSRSEKEKKDIIKKQTKTMDLFKKIANFVSIKSKESEVKSGKEISNDKKYKTDDLLDTMPDSANPLF